MKVLFLSQAPLIKYGLKCGFDQLGHETQFLDQECYAIWEKSPEEHVRLLLNRVKSFKPDIIFTEGYSLLPMHVLYPEFKKMGIPTFVWCIEDPVSPHIGNYLATHSDYAFTTTIERVPDYNKMGKPSSVLMFGCNPEFHKPVPAEDCFKHDISLVARNYSNRYDKTKWFVLPFVEKKFDIKIYGLFWMDLTREVNLKGHEWAYWKKYPYTELPYEWLPIVVNSSKIMLGMNCSDASTTQMSMRPFETLCCSNNSLLLAHYTPAQHNVFGEHIYSAKNPDEAQLMANEILSMTDEQRIEKAKLAREFTIKYHNYTLRAEQVIEAYNSL